MKVCINILENKKNIGPVIFSRQLASELEKLNVKIVDRDQKHDVLLAVIRDYNIESSRKKGAKIVHRLDGIYHNLDQDYKLMNSEIKRTYEEADSIIYQCNFSKDMVKKYFGEKEGLEFIIHNGADEKKFKKTEQNNKKNIFLCSSRWRPTKRLKSITEGFIYSELPNSKLWVVGEPDVCYMDKNIVNFGDFDHKFTKNFYKKSDFFVHLAYDDICPNSVVEALVSEIPVICTSNGGTKELVKDSGEIINEPKYDMEPYSAEDIPNVDYDNLKSVLEKVIEKRNEYEFPREDLYMSTCAKNYLEVFEKTLDN
tara:strand:+ start:706 stop:1641 length:936 start_codon:yes stop_codon:yes gene_type:complete